MSRNIVALICPKHGFSATSFCPHCDVAKPNETVHINTYDWVRQGTWEHIDSNLPHLKIDSKEDLIRECEARGLYPKALMKPKSQGKGFEISRRGYG